MDMEQRARLIEAKAYKDRVIAAAIRDGKIAASQRADYARRYDTNPLGMYTLLTAPVEQGGLAAGQVRAEEDYPSSWLPELRQPTYLAPNHEHADRPTMREAARGAAPAVRRGESAYPSHWMAKPTPATGPIMGDGPGGSIPKGRA